MGERPRYLPNVSGTGIVQARCFRSMEPGAISKNLDPSCPVTHEEADASDVF